MLVIEAVAQRQLIEIFDGRATKFQLANDNVLPVMAFNGNETLSVLTKTAWRGENTIPMG
jgi:hypothetical protein